MRILMHDGDKFQTLLCRALATFYCKCHANARQYRAIQPFKCKVMAGLTHFYS